MKTYSSHSELINDMLKYIKQIHFVIFGKRKWDINGFKFKPILHNKRYEKGGYRFEADVLKNVKAYEQAMFIKSTVKKLSIKLNQNEKQQ
jgi:hypothetical protein